MHFVSITAQNIGPFYEPARLEIDPQVTVITGANDVGKSILLDILYSICNPSGNASILPNKVNRQRFKDTGTDAERDKEVKADFVVEVDEFSKMEMFDSRLEKGTHVAGAVLLALAFGARNTGVRKTENIIALKKGGTSTSLPPIQKFPRAILIRDVAKLGEAIELSKPSYLDKCFIDAVFGSKFNYETLDKMGIYSFDSYVSDAQRKLQEHADQILPSALGYRFKLFRSSQEQTKLIVRVLDSKSGSEALVYRGSGAQKIFSLMVMLISFVGGAKPCLILIDEPENSLHSDAQRTLRNFLERLSSSGGVQVIYATHSPVMINSLKPNRLRLITLEKGEETAIAKIDNKPFDENMRKVRTSLGILPSDSLLYSDVCIIVEGKTEIYAFEKLFLKLAALDPRFENADYWLTNIHIVNGGGDNFVKLCKLAKAQGSKPIIFVDGDKHKRVKTLKLDKDVPVVTLLNRDEFENLVETNIYLKAVADVHGIDESDLTVAKFEQWLKSTKIKNIEFAAFSKQVENWLIECFKTELDRKLMHGLDKANTMIKAIEFVSAIEQVRNCDTLLELQNAVLNKLKLI